MTLVALDRAAVLALAQQLEARCDPVFVAQELRAIVNAAKPATDPVLVADMRQEIESYGRCRAAIHAKAACTCRRCRIMAAVPA